MVRTAIRACQGEKPTPSCVIGWTPAPGVLSPTKVFARAALARQARGPMVRPAPRRGLPTFAHVLPRPRDHVRDGRPAFRAYALRRSGPRSERAAGHLQPDPRGTTLTCFAAFDYVSVPTLLRQRSRDAGEATR